MYGEYLDFMPSGMDYYENSPMVGDHKVKKETAKMTEEISDSESEHSDLEYLKRGKNKKDDYISDDDNEDDDGDYDKIESDHEYVSPKNNRFKKGEKKSKKPELEIKLKRKPKASVESKVEMGTPHDIVSRLNDVGKKYSSLKTIQQKLVRLNKASRTELNSFNIVIKNILQGKNGAFQLTEEEFNDLMPYKTLFKEYIKNRTSLRRRREILSSGNLLKQLTTLMIDLEIE